MADRTHAGAPPTSVLRTRKWQEPPWRRGRGLLPAAVCATVAATLAPALAAPPALAARRTLLAPRSGAMLPARPVTVVLRDGKRVVDPTVRLNGHRARKRFAAPRHGRRRLVLTAAEGLRHGRNRLVVRYGIRGRRTKRSVRFTVSRRRPLAGPRSAPVPVVVGQRTVLDGRRSRARPATGRPHRIHRRGRRPSRRVPAFTGGRSVARAGAAARRPGRPSLDYRWKLRSAPRGSRYTRRGASPLGRRMRTSTRLGFKPDKRGTYVFALRVNDGVRSAPATVEVDALPKLPMVPVAAFGGGGVKVGGDLYRANADPKAVMQVVVLERATLELVSNTTIICPSGPGPQCTQRTRSAIAGLTSDKLVIAAAVGPWMDQDVALAGIGVVPANPDSDRNVGGGFSAIGVPGMSAGDATQRAVFGAPAPGDPGVSGYLARDLHFNYAYVSGDSLEYRFDTVKGTLTIGGQTFQPQPSPVANCAGGFHVWGFDPIALGPPKEVRTACTNVSGDPGASSSQQSLLRSLLINHGSNLMFVSSFGNPIFYVSFAQWGQLAGAFDQIGGYHHVLNSIKSGPYTLVGPLDGRFAGGGSETSTETDGRGATAPAGVLSRNSLSEYRPLITDATGQDRYDLLRTAYQPATSWPIPNSPGQRAALSYIAQSEGLGTDIRDDYWTQTYDGSRWAEIKDDIRALPYEAGKGFKKAEFATVQKELETEVGWVVNVISYFTALSKPFSQDALADWTQVGAIAKQVDSDVGTDDDDITTGTSLAVIADVLDAASLLGGEEVEPALGMLAAGLFIASDLADAEDGARATDPVRASVADFGAQLAQRFLDAQKSYERLQDIIVSDYGRLKTVGTLGGCPPSAGDCPAQWQWTQENVETASSALLLSTRRQLYQAFMPLKYVAYDITRYDVADATGLSCFLVQIKRSFRPFPNATPSGQFFQREEPADRFSHFVLAGTSQATDGGHPSPGLSILQTMFFATPPEGLRLYMPYVYLKDFQRPAFGPCLQSG